MSRTGLERYKAMLETKQTDISAALIHREDITIEKAADALDETQLAGDRELAIRTLHQESVLLDRIRRALARLAEGSYGVCLQCGCAIKAKGLEAVPWTEHCLRCQQDADRHEAENDSAESLAALRIRAA